MSRLMPFVRNLLRDLVERRLWPVPVLLVAALVAIPVVLGRGGDTPAPLPVPATPVPADTAAGDTVRAAIAIDDSPPVRRHRDGSVRNPFTSPVTPKAAAATPASAEVASPSSAAAYGSTGSSTSTSTSTPASSSGSATSAAPTASVATPARPKASTTPKTSTTPTTVTKPKTSTKEPATTKPTTTPKAKNATGAYRSTLDFGVPPAAKTIKDVARLTALPSPANPVLVYLGVLQDGKTAVFIVSSNAVPTGDGTCRPSAAACETIELKAGDTEFFDVTAADGVVTQYQLELVSIERETTEKTKKAAKAGSARHSKAGAAFLRDAAVRGSDHAAGARSYRYVPERDVLVRARRAKRVRAAASALIPGAAEAVQLLPRSQQPGIPVWYADAATAQR